jgi:hypothetical protein
MIILLAVDSNEVVVIPIPLAVNVDFKDFGYLDGCGGYGFSQNPSGDLRLNKNYSVAKL